MAVAAEGLVDRASQRTQKEERERTARLALLAAVPNLLAVLAAVLRKHPVRAAVQAA